MKNHLTILLLLLASFAAHAQSDAYLRYAPNPNLNVAFVEGFRLDDSTTVDVTVITAKDSTTWAWLIEEFNISSMHNLALSKQWYHEPKTIGTKMVQKNDPSQHVTKLIHGEFDFETISFFYKRISIYHIINQQQYNSVLRFIVMTSIKNRLQ